MPNATRETVEIPETVTVSGKAIYDVLLEMARLRGRLLDDATGETLATATIGGMIEALFYETFGPIQVDGEPSPLHAMFEEDALDARVDTLLDDANYMIEFARRLAAGEVKNRA